MLFNSFEFLIFFILVTVLYFLSPHKWRWFLLLAASCIFYMFFIPVYILILFFTIVIDYIAGIQIEKATTRQKKKLMLVMSLIANIGILVVFKYYNFLVINVNELFTVAGSAQQFSLLGIILPIGLSFHTFQAMSYTIEVYYGNQKAERHFGIYSLYVMFYPQLVAGPIERPQNILHQFWEKQSFSYPRVMSGLKLMLWGLTKKIVIADRLSIIVNEVYGNIAGYNGFAFVIATIFFAVQIYCDFSGYSDIAIGSARVMGFDLMRNFNFPYFAKSISEFWRKWHISLSTWFRDYLYIPLGGSKKGRSRQYFNLFFVFLISGLWHGANWTFIAWGGALGVGLILEALTKNMRGRLATVLPKVIYGTSARLLTITFICLTWVFFRAADITTATIIFKKMFTFDSSYFAMSKVVLSGAVTLLGQATWRFYGCFLLIGILFITEYAHNRVNLFQVVNRFAKPVKWAFYYAWIIAILFFGAFTTNQFIYFQF